MECLVSFFILYFSNIFSLLKEIPNSVFYTDLKHWSDVLKVGGTGEVWLDVTDTLH